MRFLAAVALLTGVFFISAANISAAQPKSSQFTVSANVRDAGGHTSFIFLNALDEDLSKAGPLVRFSVGTGRSNQPGHSDLSTTGANVLAGYQIVAPMLRTRLFAGFDVKNRDFSSGGADEGTQTGARVMVQLSQGREATIKFDVHGSYATTEVPPENWTLT